MVDKRIFNLSGKLNTSTNSSTHGFTVQDGQSDPNTIRHTVIPATGTIQVDNIVTGAAFAGPISTPKTLSPDYIFAIEKCYQVTANITILNVATSSTIYTIKHYLITFCVRAISANDPTISVVGANYSVIYKEDGSDIIPDDNVVVTISGDKIVVTVTPATTVEDALNIFGDFTIRCFSFLT
jgi:hypothetical protein